LSGRLALHRGSGASPQSRQSLLQYEYAMFNHSSSMGSAQEINEPHNARIAGEPRVAVAASNAGAPAFARAPDRP
jgi:hypothetical protein